MAVTRIQFLLLGAVMFAARAMAQQEVSFDAARVDAASGDHRAALQKIAKLLSSYKAPPPAERYEILMLKAECQLQLKDRMGSVTTFKSAAKSAGDLNQLANSAQDYRGGWGSSRRGLLPDEKDNLREAMAYLSKVQGRVREYREIAAKLGGDQQKWDLLYADITDALSDAQAVLASPL